MRNNGRPDLLLLILDLLEALIRRERVHLLVDQLVAEGFAAYEVLASVVHELGWLAANSDPSVGTLADLVAIEFEEDASTAPAPD